MKRIGMFAGLSVIAVLAVGCVTEKPPPKLPPPTGPGDCSTATANVSTLGGCGVDLVSFEQNCRDAEAAEAELGIRWPAACVTAAKSCDEALACKPVTL